MRCMRHTHRDEVDRRVRTGVLTVRGSEDGKPMLKGRAVVYGEETLIGDERWGFKEEIRAGALKDSIAGDDVIATYNHNADNLLGRVSNGTLRMSDSADGLDVEIDLDPETSMGKDLMRLVARRDVTGMSFAFTVESEERVQGKKRGDLDKYIVTKARVFELGPVAMPAYASTSVSLARSKRHESEAAAERQAREAEEAARKQHDQLLAGVAQARFDRQFGGGNHGQAKS